MSVTLTGTQVVVGGCIYARVLLSLRPLQSFSPDTGTTNPPKSIRGVITGMLLNITYLICWLPWIITRLCTLTSDPETRTPDDITDLQIGLKACQVLILLNALCNPLIYGSRMITMQTAYLTLYHRIRGRVRVTWHKCLGKEFGDDLPSTPLNPIESICWYNTGINYKCIAFGILVKVWRKVTSKRTCCNYVVMYNVQILLKIKWMFVYFNT
jgi:hypothetical protein